MSRAAKKAKRHIGRDPASDRRVLPMEDDRWSCVDPDGCITVRAHRNRALQVQLIVLDSDDSCHERWTQHDTEAEADEAYARAVEDVTNAPNPLPFAWILLHGLTQ